MHNIYITKSKQGDMDDLLALRSAISSFEANVSEYKGGEYDNSMLSEANIVLILPQRKVSEIGKKRTIVGRGQYNEIVYARDHGIEVYLITELDPSEIQVTELHSVHQMSNIKDWNTWGYIEFDAEDSYSLTDFVETKERNKLNQHNNRMKPMLACVNLFK